MYMLVDRAAGTSPRISIFEDEAAIRRAEPVFEKMGDEIPESLRAGACRSTPSRWRSTRSRTTSTPRA